MSNLTELCQKIGWEDWCVPYGGIENPYRIVDSTEEGARPCYKFMGEIFPLDGTFNDIIKILDKMVYFHDDLCYRIEFTRLFEHQYPYGCNIYLFDGRIDEPEEHVFSASVKKSFEESLYISIEKLNDSKWFNSYLLK